MHLGSHCGPATAVDIALSPTDQRVRPLLDAVPADLRQAIQTQVEFYFSRDNLANDAFLVSQMNSQMCVPCPVNAVIRLDERKLK